LANGHPSWKVSITGGLFTAVLFTAGKLILGAMLTLSNVKTIFGASGSFVLILLFVFYTSFIIYYGGMFTKVWSTFLKEPMALDNNAYEYTVNEKKE
jgi:membrane protein